MADSQYVLLAADALCALPDPAMAAAGLCALAAGELGSAGAALVTLGSGNTPPSVICDHPIGGASLPLPAAQVVRILDGGLLGRIRLILWWDTPPPGFDTAETLLRQIAPTFEAVLHRFEQPDLPHGRRLDFETGLWMPQEFISQVERRIDRLDIEGKYGTLLLFSWVRTDGSERPEATGAMIKASVDRLRDLLRPSDVLCRLETAKIAAWCDGMDHLTAAERATRIATALQAPIDGSGRHCVVGIASRNPGSNLDVKEMLQRAEIGLQQAKTLALAEQKMIVRIAEDEAAAA